MNTTRVSALGALIVLLSAGVAGADPAVVAASNLNLRDGPDSSHRVIAVMPHGAAVDAGDCGPQWCVVRYRGKKGFAAAAHLDRNPGNDAQAAVRPVASAVWSDPSPETAARVWRWKDPKWRDRHARKAQWLRLHKRR
jgi:uncharacterized protein YraI